MASVSFRRGVWVFDRIANDGKRKVTKCKNEKDANERLKRYLSRLELGLPPDEDFSARRKKVFVSAQGDTHTLLSDSIQKFGDVVLKPKRKPKILKIEQGFLTIMYDFFYEEGVYYVEQVTTQHIDALVAHLQQKYSAGSVNRIFGVHKLFFKMMLRWGLIAKNPTEGVGQLRVIPKQKEVWDKDTFNKALQVLPDWSRPAFKFIRMTGCRPGQATELTWDKVNFKDQTWETTSIKGGVKKTLHFPLMPDVTEMLLEIRNKNKKRFKAGPKDPVFLNVEGTGAIRTDYLYTLIKRNRKHLGNKDFNPYGLRTTFGTEMVRAGMPLKFVSELVGHSDTRTTERWYVKDVSKEARKALEQRMRVVK